MILFLKLFASEIMNTNTYIRVIPIALTNCGFSYRWSEYIWSYMGSERR